jgi:dihydrofolate reductase
MSKVIAAINMTIDGFCDHTSGIPDEEIHDHYTKLLGEADVILYGRKTYELMRFWQTLLENPSGEKSMDDFAVAIDRVPKIVFSRTLKETGWKSATLSTESPEETVRELRRQQGKNIFIGSRSLINQLMQLQLIDEFQLCIHPVVAGSGLPLFENIDRTVFKLTKTKTFSGGAVTLYYQPANDK